MVGVPESESMGETSAPYLPEETACKKNLTEKRAISMNVRNVAPLHMNGKSCPRKCLISPQFPGSLCLPMIIYP